ncbi:MAG: RsmB/NOP family class I SAM-dependent RNA methyltransferase [Flammeovirgaceae bacterium]|nr:RsmB/NOP family class I SAM-dependent RNA methyltransferase [Flammeovirgaceae bacterium]
MKLYRNLAEAVVQSLQLIVEENKYADKVIEKVLKSNPKWGARDRRFIAETTYDIVRWYRLFKRIGSAQHLEYWKFLAVWCWVNSIPLPNWSEFEEINVDAFEKAQHEIKGIRKLEQSIPDWLDELGEKELGDRWEKELAALNEEASVVLRANTLKISQRDLQKILLDDGIETLTLDGLSDALILETRQNVFIHPSFKEGLFEVQDAASQLIAPFMQVQPGMRVIDACAGAGGKTLHLSALMQNKGKVIALDTETWKLDELKKRARRAGAMNIETRQVESSKSIKRLAQSADRVLLDVPCSGLGVLKRNPDAKWKLTLEFIEKVKELQAKILDDYSVMVKPGGFLIYSTCSLLASENEEQIKKFQKRQSGFKFIEENRIWPSEGFDGFYMARLQKL